MSSAEWLPMFVSVAGILIVAYVLGSRLFAGTGTVSRSFWCQFRERNVQVIFRESAWDNRFDVEACDAFTPVTDVRCDKACLRLKELPDARVQPPEPPPRSWRLVSGVARVAHHPHVKKLVLPYVVCNSCWLQDIGLEQGAS
jgi:hypothetical protein